MIKPLKYLREVQEETKNVTWPSKEKTFNMTLLVIGVSLFIALFIAGADYVFNQLLSVLI